MKKLFAFSAATAALIAAIILLFAYHLHRLEPHGPRQAFMGLLGSDLYRYESDNGGWFPTNSDPSIALAAIYPDKCGFPAELAGLSGDVEGVQRALSQKRSIIGLTSWIYLPGFRRDDDPHLAILWESEPGLNSVGGSAPNGNRPVLLVDGTITNVPASLWEGYLINQEMLRRRTLDLRSKKLERGKTND